MIDKYIRAVICLVLMSISSMTFSTPSMKCKLVIAWEEWKPRIYQEQGQLKGVEYEKLTELASKVNCQIEFVEQPWARALVSLQNNTIDLLYAASYQSKRDTFATYSSPYRYETYVLVSKESDTPGEVRLSSWLTSEKTIGLIRGFHYGKKLEPVVRNFESKHKIIEVRHDHQMLKMIDKKRIDGFIVEKQVAEYMLSTSNNLYMINITEAVAEPVFLMFSKQVPTNIVERFNQAIIGSDK